MVDHAEWTSRQAELRVTVPAVLTRPPGRKQSWTAEWGSWRVSAPTEKAARDMLIAGMSAFLDLYREPTVIMYEGYVAVVSLDTIECAPYWHVQVFRPNGKRSTSSHCDGGWDHAEAYARWLLVHYTVDNHDDASVHAGAAFLAGGEQHEHGQYGPAELVRYAQWQRAAKHAIDAGIADYHTWACEHEREERFAVPPAAGADVDRAAMLAAIRPGTRVVVRHCGREITGRVTSTSCQGPTLLSIGFYASELGPNRIDDAIMVQPDGIVGLALAASSVS